MQRTLSVVLTIIGLALSIGRAADDNEEKPKKEVNYSTSNVWGSFGLYAGMFNFADLSKQLQGFTTFNSNQLMLGGGGLMEFSQFTMGGYGFGGHQTASNGSTGTRLNADYAGGFFEAGWLPLATPHLKIGPALGIGGAGFSLTARPTSDSIPFDSLIANGVHAWKISGGGFTLAPALNIIVPIRYVGLALKLGYLWVPFDKDWSLEDGPDIRPAPNLSSSGPFASVQITLGSDEGGTAEPKVRTEGKSGEENKEGNKEGGKE